MPELPIACPKCAVEMEIRTGTPREGGRPVRVDVCTQCSGLWLDEYELAEASATLGGLPFRMDEVRAAGTPASAIARCPRGRARPIELTVLDVVIDICPDCRGVWLDGGEFDELSRAEAIEAAAGTTLASYRIAPKAAKAIQTGVFECPRCGEERSNDFGCYTQRGLVCRGCFYAKDQREMHDEAHRSHGKLSSAFREGDVAPGIGGALFRLLGAVLQIAAGAAGGDCPTCGARLGGPGCVHG